MCESNREVLAREGSAVDKRGRKTGKGASVDTAQDLAELHIDFWKSYSSQAAVALYKSLDTHSGEAGVESKLPAGEMDVRFAQEDSGSNDLHP